MLRLLRFVVRIALIPLIVALGYEAFVAMRSTLSGQIITWFVAGLGAYLLFYVALFGDQGKTIQFLETFKHELSHAAILLLVLKLPETFAIDVSDDNKSDTGGGVRPSTGCFLGLLAPYYLPVFTIPLLLIKPVTPSSLHKVMDFIIGFSLAIHYITAIKDFHYKQTDITRTGKVFSLVMTILLNIVWLVIILCVVTDNYGGIVTYFKSSVSRAVEIYKATPQRWQTTAAPALASAWEGVQQVWE